jgi:hypothetical protein
MAKMNQRGIQTTVAPRPVDHPERDGSDPELARVEAEIARTRARVARSLVALRREMARRADWREWVRRHPLPFMAGAFLLGALLGSRRRRSDVAW